MGLTDSKFRLPSFAAIRNLRTLQELPLCTAGQVQEAFNFLQDSPYAQQLSVNQQAFEDIFGVLFQDPSIHFATFHRPGVPVGVTMEIFVLIILFCDASLPQKLRLLCDFHIELRQNIRLDALQFVVYRVLYCMPLFFHLEIPNRDTIYNFVEESVRQYKDRSQIAVESSRKANANANANLHAHSSRDEGSTTVSQTFDFTDLWQWCQDVNQVSSYLDSIQKICQMVNTKVDRSHKGRSWMARNSFFATSTAIRGSMMGDMMSVLRSWGNENSGNGSEYLFRRLVQHRHPLWKYTIHDISMQDCELWLTDPPRLHHESRVFCSLEHLVLSRSDCLPIYKPFLTHQHSHRNNMATGGTTELNRDRSTKVNATSTAPASTALYSVVDHMTLLSFVLESCPGHVFKSLQRKRSRRLSFEEESGNEDFVGNEEKDTIGAGASSSSANNNSSEEGREPSFRNLAVEEEEKKEPKEQEDKEKEKETEKEESEDDDDNMPMTLRHRNRFRKIEDTVRPWQSLGELLGQALIDGMFSSLASLIAANNSPTKGNSNSNIIGGTNDSGLMQSRESMAANLGLLSNRNSQPLFRPYHVRQAMEYRIKHGITYHPNHHSSSLHMHNVQGPLQLQAFNMDHHIYNLISLFALGYRHIPITAVQDNQQLLHIVNIYEIAGFLLEHYAEFFPTEMTTRSVMTSGLMRKPVVVARTLNLANAWMVMISAALESCLITDEQDKVCGVLTAKHLESLWWNYKQQHQTAASFDDLVADYSQGLYHPYDPYTYTGINSTGGHSPNMHLMNVGMVVNNHTSVHNFSSLSVLAHVLQQCDRLDIHTCPFDSYMASDEATAQRQLQLWQMRLVRFSNLEAIQRGGLVPDEVTAATNSNVVKSDLKNAVLGSGDGGDGGDSVVTESGPPVPGKVHPSPARPRDPPPSQPSHVTNTQVAPPTSATNQASVVASSNINSNHPASSGSAVPVAVTSRAHKIQALRQKEKLREQSRLRAARSRRLEQWFVGLKLVTPFDTLRAVLQLMYSQRTSCVHVVSTEGVPFGVVVLHDICRYLISHEQKARAQFAEQQIRQEKLAAVQQKVKDAFKK